jgi:hypothetical protein
MERQADLRRWDVAAGGLRQGGGNGSVFLAVTAAAVADFQIYNNSGANMLALTQAGVLTAATLTPSNALGVAYGGTGAINASGARSNLGLVIDTDIQAHNADLDVLAGATTGAWTAFTPTISASSGTFTTVSASGTYAHLGKIIVFQMTITMTTIGTAAGTLRATLPTTANNIATFSGRENAVTGLMVQGNVSPASNTLSILKADNTSIIASGNVIRISGFYESQ